MRIRFQAGRIDQIPLQYLTPDNPFPQSILRKGRWESKPQPRSAKGMDPMLLKAIIDGDIGSWFEGPALGGRAPDFKLRSPGGRSVTLSDSFAIKPTVLIFGSFT